jgi:hypothetical protein
LVDELTGVIPALAVGPALRRRVAANRGDGPAHHLVVQGRRVIPLPVGWGKGSRQRGPVRSAVSETVERYSAFLGSPRIIWKATRRARRKADPRELLYAEERYAGRFFCPVQSILIRHPWVQAFGSFDFGPVRVPVTVFLSLT